MLNKTKAFRESLLSGSHTKTAGFVMAVTKISSSGWTGCVKKKKKKNHSRDAQYLNTCLHCII